MFRIHAAQLVGAVALSCVARQAAADEITLTRVEALDLARKQAPALIESRGAVAEARGRRAGAAVLLRENPTVEVLAGTRTGSETVDYEISFEQMFELGGKRGARQRGADATVARTTAAAADATRVTLREVAISFARALHARKRLEVTRAAQTVAQELARIARRRHDAGDIADLHLNLARVAEIRARADVTRAEAALDVAVTDLAVRIGADPTTRITPTGDLAERRSFAAADLADAIAARPDVRALEAEAREGQAAVDLGDAFRWPDLGIRLQVSREGPEDILLGGVVLRLPLFERGQESRATGTAVRNRARAQADARRRAAAAELSAALRAHQRLGQALSDEEAIRVVLDDNEDLGRKSFEAGQIGVAEYLLVRREIVDARLELLDRELDVALAAIDVETTAGVLR